MRVKVCTFLAALLLILQGPPVPAQELEEPPPLEVLEFLADWETAGGKWIDPTRMEEIPLPADEDDEDEENETP